MSAVSNPYRQYFTAACCRCSGRCYSDSAATGEAPFTYVCFQCQTEAQRDEVRAANFVAWHALDANEKHTFRVRTLGAYKTEEIERRLEREGRAGQ